MSLHSTTVAQEGNPYTVVRYHWRPSSDNPDPPTVTGTEASACTAKTERTEEKGSIALTGASSSHRIRPEIRACTRAIQTARTIVGIDCLPVAFAAAENWSAQPWSLARRSSALLLPMRPDRSHRKLEGNRTPFLARIRRKTVYPAKMGRMTMTMSDATAVAPREKATQAATREMADPT